MPPKRKYVERRSWLAHVSASNVELTPAEKLVGVIIAELYSDAATGRAWPSHQTLAKATNLSKKTVQRALNKLVSKGFLLRLGFSENRTRVYQIPLDRFSEEVGEPLAEAPQSTRPLSAGKRKSKPLSYEQVEKNRFNSWRHRVSQITGVNLMTNDSKYGDLKQIYANCQDLKLTDEASTVMVKEALKLT